MSNHAERTPQELAEEFVGYINFLNMPPATEEEERMEASFGDVFNIRRFDLGINRGIAPAMAEKIRSGTTDLLRYTTGTEGFRKHIATFIELTFEPTGMLRMFASRFLMEQTNIDLENGEYGPFEDNPQKVALIEKRALISRILMRENLSSQVLVEEDEIEVDCWIQEYKEKFGKHPFSD